MRKIKCFQGEEHFKNIKLGKKILTCLFIFLKWIPVKSFKTVWWIYPLDPGNLCQSHPDLWELVNVFVCIRYILILSVYFSALPLIICKYLSPFPLTIASPFTFLQFLPQDIHTNTNTLAHSLTVQKNMWAPPIQVLMLLLHIGTCLWIPPSMLFCIFQLSKLKNSTLLFPLHPICFTAYFLF